MKQFEEWHKNNHQLVPESMGNIAREGWKAALEWAENIIDNDYYGFYDTDTCCDNQVSKVLYEIITIIREELEDE